MHIIVYNYLYLLLVIYKCYYQLKKEGPAKAKYID